MSQFYSSNHTFCCKQIDVQYVSQKMEDWYTRTSFLLPSCLVWHLLPTHCGCGGLLLSWVTLNDIHTLGKSPLDVGSVRLRNLYRTTHNTHKRQPPMTPIDIRTRNPSKQAATDLRLRPRNHRDRPHTSDIIYQLPEEGVFMWWQIRESPFTLQHPSVNTLRKQPEQPLL